MSDQSSFRKGFSSQRVSRRTFLGGAAALGVGTGAASALLAACGGNAAPTTITGTETLTFVNSDNSLPNAIGAYNKTYPHLKFNVVTSGWGPGGQDMKEKELVMMSGGDYPDPTHLDTPRRQPVGEFAGCPHDPYNPAQMT